MAARSSDRPDRIVDILAAAGRPLTASDVADRLWADDLDGGPETAENIVSTTIFYMRQRGDRRIITTPAGYVLADWPHDPAWDNRRVVWTDRVLDRIEAMAASGARHAEIAVELGVSRTSVSVALWKYRPGSRRLMRAA